MSLTRMCGVVLWSNPDDQKAVVWCEDQGKLAYYVESKDSVLTGVALDAGDLIEFELREERQYRRVTNPVLLVEDHAPEIARNLDDCANTGTPAARPVKQSNVLTFPKPRKQRPMGAAAHVMA